MKKFLSLILCFIMAFSAVFPCFSDTAAARAVTAASAAAIQLTLSTELPAEYAEATVIVASDYIARDNPTLVAGKDYHLNGVQPGSVHGAPAFSIQFDIPADGKYLFGFHLYASGSSSSRGYNVRIDGGTQYNVTDPGQGYKYKQNIYFCGME